MKQMNQHLWFWVRRDVDFLIKSEVFKTQVKIFHQSVIETHYIEGIWEFHHFPPSIYDICIELLFMCHCFLLKKIGDRHLLSQVNIAARLVPRRGTTSSLPSSRGLARASLGGGAAILHPSPLGRRMPHMTAAGIRI